ncbi:MAG: hypothetical protein HZC28_15045 [Spirochaetes bacterium]|nr:hypothetical protein [Spirochaetota bacterium]
MQLHKTFLLLLLVMNAAASLTARTVFVLPFENKERSAERYKLPEALAVTFGDMLRENGRFTVYDRERIKAALFEKKIPLKSGRQLFDLLSDSFTVDYIFSGEVRSFRVSERITGRQTNTVASVEISIRVIDADSGRTVQQLSARAETNGSGIFHTAEDSMFTSSAPGVAVRETFLKLIAGTVEALRFPPLAGTVIKVDGRRMYLNIGKDSAAVIGDMFELFRYETNTVQEDSTVSTNAPIIEKNRLSTNTNAALLEAKKETLRRMLKPPAMKAAILGTVRIVDIYSRFSIAETVTLTAPLPASGMIFVRELPLSAY